MNGVLTLRRLNRQPPAGDRTGSTKRGRMMTMRNRQPFDTLELRHARRRPRNLRVSGVALGAEGLADIGTTPGCRHDLTGVAQPGRIKGLAHTTHEVESDVVE